MDDSYFLYNFNTPLSHEEMRLFYAWGSEESRRQGRNVFMDAYNYDLQGFFKSGEWRNRDSRGHGADRFKKPNHPTFSNESMYHGVDGFQGGQWTKGGFKPGPANKKIWGKDRLKRYFKEREPDQKLYW